MPSEPISFGPMQTTSGSELGGAQRIAANVVWDPSGAVRRRPCLTEYSGASSEQIDSSGIELLHVDQGGRIWAVTSGPPRRIHRVTASGSLAVGPTSIPGPQLYRTTAAHTEAMSVFAAGGGPTKLLYSSMTTSPLAGSPPVMTHVAAQSGRLVGNNLSQLGQVWYSGIATSGDTAGHEQWSLGVGVAGFVSAEARPDPVVAVHENTNELFVFGVTSLQVYSPDPNFVFAPGSTREHGCLAPYSIIKRDQQFAWLDHRRRFVVSDGRTVETISDPIQSQLDVLSSVSDCYGFRLRVGRTDVLAWVFPTAGLAFAFQAGGWSQWASYSGAAVQLLNFGAATERPQDGAQLVATRDGRIGQLSEEANTDLGETVKAHVTSGFQNRGGDRYKHCRKVRVAMRRGLPGSSTAPVGWLSWQDEPDGHWRRLPVNFGRSHERFPVVTFSSLGTYRRRNWRFEFAEDSSLELVSVEEEFDVGDE